MAEDLMRYDLMAQEALRGVMRTALAQVAISGLPGDHHFYIAFSTTAEGVRLSERLLERYDDEMTIVLQHQFSDLEVTDTGFSVELSFDNIPEMLTIPFSAIKGFFDPAVQFGLQFESAEANENIEAGAAFQHGEVATAGLPTTPATPALESDAGGHDGAVHASNTNVVALDAFRRSEP
jgi:hypothetical protein